MASCTERMMDMAVRRPVLGFSEGTFSMWTVRYPNSPSTSMSWQLRSRPGTASIFTKVRSGPTPARLTAADTFRLAGKPFTASRAVPEKTSVSSSRPSRLMPFSTIWGAPSRPTGGLRETMVTRSTPLAQADFIPSRPAMAPEGARRRQPVSRDRWMMLGFSSRAPMLMTIRSLPAENTSSASSATTCPPAVSTNRSETSISSFLSR